MKIKKKIFLGLVGIGLVVIGTGIIYQKKQCFDCIWISTPIEFEKVSIQGEVSLKKLASLSFEEKKSFSKSVSNCHDFWEKGLPESNYMESKGADYYRGFCSRLKLLQQVKQAKENYLKDFNLTQAEYLPPTIVTAGGADDYDLPLEKAAEKGESLQTFIQQKKVAMSSDASNALSVKFVYLDMQTQLIEIARGDFNGDGVEDILIQRNVNPTVQATYAFYGSLLLTRTSDQGMIEVKKL